MSHPKIGKKKLKRYFKAVGILIAVENLQKNVYSQTRNSNINVVMIVTVVWH